MFYMIKFEKLLMNAGWKPMPNANSEIDVLLWTLRDAENLGWKAEHRKSNYANIMAVYWNLSNRTLYQYREAITYLEHEHDIFRHKYPINVVNVFIEDRHLLRKYRNDGYGDTLGLLPLAVKGAVDTATNAAVMVHPPEPDSIFHSRSNPNVPRVNVRKCVMKWFGEETFTPAARRGLLAIGKILSDPSVSVTFYDATTEINKMMRELVRDELPLPKDLSNILMTYHVGKHVSYKEYFANGTRDQMPLPKELSNIILQYMGDSIMCPPYFISPKDRANTKRIRIGVEKTFVEAALWEQKGAVFCAVAQIALGLHPGYFPDAKDAQRDPNGAQKCANNWTGFAQGLASSNFNWRQSAGSGSCSIM